MNDKIKTIANQSLRNEPISREDAHYLMQINSDEIYDVFYWANQIRLRYFGHSIKTCSIVSATGAMYRRLQFFFFFCTLKYRHRRIFAH